MSRAQLRHTQLRHAHRGWRLVALVAVAVALTSCGNSTPEERFQGSDVSGAPWGRDFHLVDPTGNLRSLADYRGKVVMLFFGYTNCPDECPATLAKMAQVVDRLGADGKRVQGLFVAVDPARDTPQVLARFVASFHPTFVGLTADPASIAATARDFKVYFAAQPPGPDGGYTVDHSSGIFVFDARGRLRILMSQAIGVDAMVHDLRLLVREAATEDR